MADETITISGNGLINVHNLSDPSGYGSFLANSIIIQNVDGSQVFSSQFVANPSQLTDQTEFMDVNYDYNGPQPIPSGSDTVPLNPVQNTNPQGAAAASSDITSGTVYVWPVDGGGLRKGAPTIGHMTYKKNVINR